LQAVSLAVPITEVPRGTATFKSMFISAVFLQRLGVWIGGYPFPVCLAVFPIGLGWLLFQQIARISISRLVLYTPLPVTVIVSVALGVDRISGKSAILYILMYFFFIFQVNLSWNEYEKYYRFIFKCVSVLCVIGAIQYIAQFAVRSSLLFSWKGIVPDLFLIEYNTLNVFSYGVAQYKANGFFLMEASVLSQLAARALLLSIFLFRDIRYIPFFALGLLTAYSGTGLIFTLVFTAIPLALTFLRAGSTWLTLLIIALLCGAVVAILAADLLRLDFLLGRIDEFSNPKASGYLRFTGPVSIMWQNIRADELRFLFGYGPGSSQYILGAESRSGFAPGWVKLILEYGMLGFAVFAVFFGYCIYTSCRSWYLVIAFTFHFTVLDGNILVPQHAFTAYLLSALPVLVRPTASGAKPRVALRRAQ
jgi:hypothetical protein